LPLSFAVFILLIRGLHEGEKVWLSLSIVGYKLVLKEEGLWNGLQTCSKVLGGISLVILLSFNTTISQLCAGLKWFRVPNTIIDLLALMYRYIRSRYHVDCTKNTFGSYLVEKYNKIIWDIGGHACYPCLCAGRTNL